MYGGRYELGGEGREGKRRVEGGREDVARKGV